MIDTAKVERRALRFAGVHEMRAEVERVHAWARAGEARAAGNWSVGQIFGHLAFWIEEIDHDKGVRVAWYGRVLARLMKRRILTGRPAAGYELLVRAMARLERGDFPSVDRNWGRMRPEDWLNLHLRHAELHLGFVFGPGA
jgi:hypothetical protein